MAKMTSRICENCSKEFFITVYDADRGRGRFCGRNCAASGKHNSAYRHGNSTRKSGQTKEYKTWAGIKQRTTNSNNENSKYYVLRGIKMCDRWLNSFDNFLEDMGKSPSPKHSIDRIDVNGNYEPSNCRWATHLEQMSNMRSNKILTLDGESHTQEEWGRITGIGGTAICKRLRRGWTVEKALKTPLKTIALARAV